jgi:hypothetical protein
LVDQGQVCDPTFRFTRAYFARYAPDVDVEGYIHALEAVGAHCGVAVGNNLGAEMGC